MFWKQFGVHKLVPFLLASSSPPVQNYAPPPPSSLKDIRSGMDQMYQDLVDNPGSVTRRVSPTLTFSYVSPPSINGISTWRASSSSSSSLLPAEDVSIEQHQEDNNGKKPIAIYLPGLDGTGISAFTHQFDDMARTFELWRLIITTEDRSDFRQVLGSVVGFVEEVARNHTDREIVLVGESFGGVLASAVALNIQKRATSRASNRNATAAITSTSYRNPLKGLVLVNPATAFHDTNWDTIVPILASLQYLSNNETDGPTPYSLAGGMALSYLIPDTNQLGRIGDLVLNAVGIPPPQEAVDDMLGLLEILEERLPADTLQHRVNQWLSVGTSLVNERLPQLQLPTLVLAGDQDRIMPSDKEAERLIKIIPCCEKLIIQGRGHLVLDENVNLTEAIIYSKIDPLGWRNDGGNKKQQYDPIMDWTLPPHDEVKEIIEQQVKPLRNVHSPVFFSTDSRGKRWKGLAKVPQSREGPILFVANHQFFGLDLSMIITELLQDRKLVCRGLAHPIVFNQTTEHPELRGRTPGLVASSGPGAAGGVNSFSNFQKFGAVPVTPRNYYRLMQSGQNALLFPGGVKDVFQTDPSYPLLWPEKPDFVRTAARFNATIVPLSAVGMLESARVLVEAKDLERIPFLGKRISEAGGFPAARFDAPEGERDPLPPIPFPNMPKRNYFIFGMPFSTSEIDPKDKEACAKLYKDVVGETRRGLDDVLAVRDEDPFYDTPRRVAYEQVTQKRAPTIGIEKLNRLHK